MKVKAIDNFTYAGMPYKIGDDIDMPDKDAKLLSECIAPRVTILQSRTLSKPEQEHLSPKIETTELKAEEQTIENDESKSRSIRSRRYMRRDMTPQE